MPIPSGVYKIAAAIEADLRKRKIPKGSSEWNREFSRAAKSLRPVGKAIGETGLNRYGASRKKVVVRDSMQAPARKPNYARPASARRVIRSRGAK